MSAAPEWLRPITAAVENLTVEQLTGAAAAPPRSARSSAVLMLFGEAEHGPDLLLTERSHTMRSHPGQLSFPGGAADPGDEGPVATALREAEEEVGLDPSGVDVIGLLPSLWVPPSNFAVTVVLGWWRSESPVAVVDPDEVHSVLRVPIDHLLDPVNRFMTVHPSGWRGPSFEVGDGLTLWGFTAGVAARLFAHVGWEKPWDLTRERPLPEIGGGW